MSSLQSLTIRILAPVLTLAALAAPRPALAWKVYTHNYAGQKILEAIDFAQSTIEIDGQRYPVDHRVTAAINACRACFNAGVVGPDGFPDLTYGQSVIHPARTGAWLDHLFRKAWAAQGLGSPYSDAEKKQILAFTYGFLFHATGDLWAHTMVNELSGEVFPSVFEALADPEKMGIALKHVALEGVLGDATPGFDGDREHRKTAPGGYGQSSGDVSNDATPGFEYAVPKRFIYDALISASDTPVQAQRGHYVEARGPLIGFFLEMRDGLQDFINDTSPDTLQDAINAYQETLAALNNAREDCNFEDALDILHDAVACPAALLELGFDFAVDSLEAFLAIVIGITEDLIFAVLDAYLAAWVSDINKGLRDWADFGLASSQGLFDPQTRRNIQNERCAVLGNEGSGARADCEAEVTLTTALFEKVEPFVNDHLLSMIGLPDAVGDVNAILGEISDVVDQILAVAGLPLRPFLAPIHELKQWIRSLILDAIEDAIGIDLEQLTDLLEAPTHTLCQSSIQMDLFDNGALVTIPLFQDDQHQRLDDYLGFTGNHHVPEQGVGPECGRLTDNTQLDAETFAPFRNTVAMGKLLMLEGGTLDELASQRLGRTISTYGAGGAAHVNVMIKSFQEPDGSWLRLIDGDHAWRRDGRPVFEHHATDAQGQELLGGDGHMPLFASCVLRPAFRGLFLDWENPWQGTRGPLPGTALDRFPSLGDAPMPDADNDPLPPRSHLALTGTTYSSGPTQFVAADHAFTFTASDSVLSPAGKSFRPDQLGLRRRIYSDPLSPGGFVAAYQGEALHLDGADGAYFINYQSSDPCHTFENAAEPVGAPEVARTVSAILDTKAPAVTCMSPPFGLTYATDGSVVIRFGVWDGPLGSGIASIQATIDGVYGSAGPVPVVDGASLVLFDLDPGTRTVAVSTADNLKNAATTGCTFEVHATAASLLVNLRNAYRDGIISYGMYQSLAAKLQAARAAKTRGQLDTEVNVLRAFIGELRALSGKRIDATFADKLIAFAQDLVDSGG
jgi:hypothetical protein